MRLFKKLALGILTILLVVMAGCNNSPLYNQTENNVADVVQRTQDARHMSDASGKVQPSLVVRQELYVDKTPVNLNKEPAWLKNHIIIRGDDLPFTYYSRTVVNNGNLGRAPIIVRDAKATMSYYAADRASSHDVLTRYQVGLDPNAKISINYSGSVKGALDLLAAKTGYVYTVNGNDIYWQAFITKTFDVAFMPGTSDYMMGKASGGGSVGSVGGGGNSSSSSGGQTVSAMLDDSAQSQYSSLKGTLSVWDDLTATIKTLISPEGRVIVSQATTSVTVRDRPTNLELVSQYIANFNNSLSKQVLVKVQVLEVSLSNDYNYGINWDVVQRAFGGSNFIFHGDFGTPVSITSLSGAAAIPTLGLKKELLRTGTWFTILVNALTQQGKVSVVSEPRVVCLNNQVSAIRIVNQEGYLASIQNTTVPGAAGTSTITSQITPGTLVTGLTLYILPKIMNNKIYLQVNADLSDKISIQSVSTSPDPTAAGAQSIQVPNVTQKQFNQRSVIASGDTLILSGFRKVRNNTGAMQYMTMQALGGKGATQTNTDTVVLITPIILHGVV